jgi:hypothetical protein
MFVVGDDAANKPKVVELVGALGFEVVDAGPLRNARLLEAHAMLWIDLALNLGSVATLPLPCSGAKKGSEDLPKFPRRVDAGAICGCKAASFAII